jgi:hypothetical protein
MGTAKAYGALFLRPQDFVQVDCDLLDDLLVLDNLNCHDLSCKFAGEGLHDFSSDAALLLCKFALELDCTGSIVDDLFDNLLRGWGSLACSCFLGSGSGLS